MKKKVPFFTAAAAVLAVAIFFGSGLFNSLVMSISADEATVGAFLVTGGTKDVDYSYDSDTNVLTINPQSEDTEITIKNADNSMCNVKITLAKGTNNTLKAGGSNAAIQKIGDSNTSIRTGILEITGNGLLYATGNDGGAGIGGCDGMMVSVSNITISGGTVIATGGEGGAGIGVGSEVSGITISGGTVIATGGEGGAGIGGNCYVSGITISGGTVTATGGDYGAGIGGIFPSNITISGGTVTATGGYEGAGIGGNNGCDVSNIIIRGGTVTATGGYGGAGIGGGDNGSASNIKITGGSVNAVAGEGANAIGGGSSQAAVTPTNDSGNEVYLLTIANASSEEVYIDGSTTAYTPSNHAATDEDDTNLYLYLTGETHTVKVGSATEVTYSFENGKFLLPPSANDFTFTAPTENTYTGSAINASVTSSKAGMGTITVKYYNSKGEETQPVNVGTYTVKADVAAGDSYASATGITDNWTFTIEQAERTATEDNVGSVTARLESDNTYSVSISPSTDAEFSPANSFGSLVVSNEVWISNGGTLVITNVAHGTTASVKFRLKGTDNYKVSEPITISVTTGHGTLTPHEAVTATCKDGGTDGNSEYWECKSCRMYFSDESGTSPLDAIPTTTAPAHTSDNGVVTTPATTTSAGVRTYTCTVCGDVIRTEDIPMLEGEHEHSYNLTYDSTSHWLECSCGDKKDTESHEMSEWETTEAPTCTSAGTKTRSCTVCEYTETDTVDAFGHDADTEWTSDESGHWHICHNDLTEQLDKASHTEDSGVVTTEATTTSTGVKTYSCTVCGYVTGTETIPVISSENSSSGGSSTDSSSTTGGSSTSGGAPSVVYPSIIPSRPSTTTTSTATTTTTTATTSDSDSKGPKINGGSGWTAVSDKIAEASEGTSISIDMNGTTAVPKSVISDIAGKDITLVLDMGDGISWSVNGKNVTNPKNVDLGISKGANTIPVDVINSITGESYTIELSLTYDGEFGFTAVLSIDLGSSNDGLYANLYYYNPKTNAAEIMGSSVIKDGKASLEFTHASDWAIVISDKPAYTDDAASDAGLFAEDSDISVSKKNYNVIFALIAIAAIGTGLSIKFKKKSK
jgi:hypothetical protein